MDDLLPEDFAVKQKIVDVIREVYRLYGYEEVETPTLEYLELFEAKSGEEIRHRMFIFTDPHGRKLVLRPEVTASVARLVASKLSKRPLPLRLGYIADCYRYDEPQWGRRRRFWHGGFELFGARDPSSDAEIILASRDVFNRLAIRDYYFKLGHVGIIRGLIEEVEPRLQDTFLTMLDRGMNTDAFEAIRDKVEPEALTALNRLMGLKGSEAVLKNALDIVSPWKGAQDSLSNLSAIVEALKEADPSLRLEINLGFARGLEYYTGMIFEQKIPGEELSFNGGGRYDGLVELFGGGSIPAVGCAIGITRIQMYLTKSNARETNMPGAFLSFLSDEVRGYALQVSVSLRAAGVPVYVDVTRKKLGDAIEAASRRGVRFLVIIGLQEMREGKLTVRDLVERKQVTLGIEEAVSLISGK
jgi:histidyl-tRNA synthetase